MSMKFWSYNQNLLANPLLALSLLGPQEPMIELEEWVNCSRILQGGSGHLQVWGLWGPSSKEEVGQFMLVGPPVGSAPLLCNVHSSCLVFLQFVT